MPSRSKIPHLLALCGLAPALVAQTVYTETEPNNSKAAANGPFVLNPGDTIVGNSQGASTIPGTGSVDYFIVQAPPAPLGLYRQRLTLSTTGAPGHTGTLRGYASNLGPPEVPLQMTTSPSSPATALQWYGTGRSEWLYFRVAGSPSTPDDYTATLESAPVTATELGTLPGGFLVITSIGQGHATDTDLWVYDASLVPIPGFGNDQEPYPATSNHARLARDFIAGGDYYLAISAYDLANSRGPAPDERRVSHSAAILDFADATLSSSPLAQNLSFVIIDGAGVAHPVAAASTERYHVLWFRFTLTAPGLGACCRPDGACSEGGSSGYCDSLGGVYQGDGSTCPSISCPQPPAGACCFADGSCAQVSSFVCADAGLAWNGPGTLCSQVTCTPVRPCYPNCDSSTQPPFLNVADFTCYLELFFSHHPYANCDASTSPPVLNVADFTCYIQRFAAGCSAP